MGRLDISGSPTVELEIPVFGGLNTAKTFSEIEMSESPRMLNNLPGKIGGLAKRAGTVPLTTAAIGAIPTLANLRKAGNNAILAGSGTTLYKYNAATWTAQTMTAALNSAAFDWAQFRDATAQEVLMIADGTALKYYNGTEVKNVTPAPNDTTPTDAPANVLAARNPIGVLVHNNRLVIWEANSDTLFNSKVGFFDYFRQTDFQRFVKQNDFIQTCVSYAGALLVFMRYNIGVRFGDGYSAVPAADDWSQDFVDTSDGCVNPRSVQLVVYPDGREEVFYQSDKGVHAVYTIDTLSLDTSARYSTRNVTKNQIDFKALGLTKAEWQAATSYFYDQRYWLIYKKAGTYQGLVFDANTSQWYPVDNIKAQTFLNDEDYLYFAAEDGHLKVFDDELANDWNDAAKTSGSPVKWDWYSKLMTPKLTGFDHFWDILLIEARQLYGTSTVDVEVNTYRNQYQLTGAIKTEIMIIGVSQIGEAQIANQNLTDFVNNAKRLRTCDSGLRGQYAQIHLSNHRSEKVEIYNIKYEVRMMTKY